jgi:hypothetical protein
VAQELLLARASAAGQRICLPPGAARDAAAARYGLHELRQTRPPRRGSSAAARGGAGGARARGAAPRGAVTPFGESAPLERSASPGSVLEGEGAGPGGTGGSVDSVAEHEAAVALQVWSLRLSPSPHAPPLRCEGGPDWMAPRERRTKNKEVTAGRGGAAQVSLENEGLRELPTELLRRGTARRVTSLAAGSNELERLDPRVGLMERLEARAFSSLAALAQPS